MNTIELEVRFLEIDVPLTSARLIELGAVDHGEELLKEVIFHNQDRDWAQKHKKLVRLRSSGKKTTLAYKDHATKGMDGVKEIELLVDDFDTAHQFMEHVGLTAIRQQEKKRHTFTLGELVFDIDQWPLAPAYLEIEGPDEASLRKAAADLHLDWTKVIFEDAKTVLENHYHIPLSSLHFFTFSKIA